MKILCLKSHKNHTINEGFYFFFWGGANKFQGAPRGAEAPITKIRGKKPHTERLSQPTPKVSAFQLN